MNTKKLISLIGGASVLAAMNAVPVSAASSVTLTATPFEAYEGEKFNTTIIIQEHNIHYFNPEKTFINAK